MAEIVITPDAPLTLEFTLEGSDSTPIAVTAEVAIADPTLVNLFLDGMDTVQAVGDQVAVHAQEVTANAQQVAANVQTVSGLLEEVVDISDDVFVAAEAADVAKTAIATMEANVVTKHSETVSAAQAVATDRSAVEQVAIDVADNLALTEAARDMATAAANSASGFATDASNSAMASANSETAAQTAETATAQLKSDVEALAAAVTAEANGLMPEAPDDGKQYAAKGKTWAEVAQAVVSVKSWTTYSVDAASVINLNTPVDAVEVYVNNVIQPGVTYGYDTNAQIISVDLGAVYTGYVQVRSTVGESVSASKMPTAPDDGQQYVGKGTNWELFVPPVPEPTFFEEVSGREDMTFLWYPKRMPPAFCKGLGNIPSGQTFLTTTDVSGLKVLEPPTQASFANVGYLGYHKKVGEPTYITDFVVFVKVPGVPIDTSAAVCFASTGAGQLGINLNSNYLTVAVRDNNGSAVPYFSIPTNTLTIPDGINYFVSTIMYPADGSAGTITGWLNGVQIGSSTDGSGVLKAGNNNEVIGSQIHTKFAFFMRVLSEITTTEAAALFEKFKADNGIV